MQSFGVKLEVSDNRIVDRLRTCHSKTLHVLILGIFLVAGFGNTLVNGFVWDDSLYLLPVEAYRRFDWRSFLFGLGNGVEYQPVRDLINAIDFALWGENPAGFHSTNLILYFLNVVAVYLLAEAIVALFHRQGGQEGRARSSVIAFWTAALFALHPIHCESLDFLAGGRNTLLAGLFSFLSARSFVLHIGDASGFRGGKLAASFCWYILAVLSKATAVSLPLFFLALCIIAKQRPLLQRVLTVLPFMAFSAAVYRIFTAIAVATGVVNPAGAQIPFAERIAISAQIPFIYLGKLMLPFALSADYDYDLAYTVSLTALPVLASMAVLLLLSGGIFFFRNRMPPLFIAFCWFVAMLVPVLQFFPKQMIVSDRYAYIPSFAFCFLVALLGCALAHRFPKVPAAAGALVLCLFGILSIQQNKVWKSDYALWEHTVSVSPHSIKGLTFMGTYLFSRGNYDGAFALFDRARQTDPRNPSYDFFQGLRSYAQGNFPEARRAFRYALVRQGDYIDALYYMGATCEALRDYPSAANYYRLTLATSDVDRQDYKQKAARRLALLGDSQVAP